MKLRWARTATVIGLIALGVSAGWLGPYVWFTEGEIQENRYASYDDAQSSQRRGWLPLMLPRSATEIHEWHDLDTNLCLGSFRFDPAERSLLAATLQAGSRRPIRIDRDPSFATPLPRDPNEEQLRSAGFELYSGTGFDLAIS